MCIYSIYRVTNKINSKVYIGFTSSPIKRKYAHKKAAEMNADTKFYRAIRKYGWNNFDFKIIYQSKDYDHTLKEMENYFIVEYDSIATGYNSTSGGDGAITISGDSHHMKSKSHRERQGNLIRGDNNPIHKINDEKRKEIINGLFTKESMNKKSGLNHYNVDKTIYHFENIKTGEKVSSTKYEFARKYDLIPGSVSQIVVGKRKTTGGWKVVPSFTET